MTNGQTDICDCIVTFATENEALTHFMTTILKFVLAKYYKDTEMTSYISERSRNSK